MTHELYKFTTPIQLIYIDGIKWQTATPLYFYFDEKDKENGITIPAGFITDFASVPRFLWSFLPPTGIYGNAALVHDYLYTIGIYKRKFCDAMFLEGMKAYKVSFFVRKLMYFGVRIGGRKRFNLINRKV